MSVSQNWEISNFVKFSRGKLGMTQEELAKKAGVGLRFIRDLEQGKASLRMDKVNQVLELFGYRMIPRTNRILDAYDILINHFNKSVRFELKNKKTIYGIIVDSVSTNNEIVGWKYIPNDKVIDYIKTKSRDTEQFVQHAEIDSIENIEEIEI